MNRDKTILEIEDFKKREKRGQNNDNVLIRKKMNINSKVVDKDKRIIEFIASTPARDRDGDTINQNGWDLSNYKGNPQFLWAHDYSRTPLGRSIKTWVENGKLKTKVKFMGEDVNDRDYNEWPDELKFADLVYRMYSKGYLNAVSVGFDPKKWSWSNEEEGNIDFKSQELLEVSAVPVPANPEAVQVAGLKGADKQLIRKYYNKVKDIIDDEEVITIVDEKDNSEKIEVKEEYIWIDGKKVEKTELEKIIEDNIAEVVKKKTGRIL